MRVVRRQFLQVSAALGTAAVLPRITLAATRQEPAVDFGFGLVTYLWGQDWDLETLIANCEKTGLRAVELRTTHKHGVEPTLDKKQRAEVADRFANSSITLAGLGTDERFDAPEPEKLKAAIESAKEFVRLSHDVGGTGVKVKPDKFHEGVPHEKTIEQIGKSLNEVASFGDGFGQQIRLEVHGQCAELPTIKAIMDVADHPNVAICWNSNAQDLAGEGLAHNFNLVRDRFGQTIHVREFNDKTYPYQEFFDLLVKTDYVGWVLLEASSTPQDRMAALAEQNELFEALATQAVKNRQ